MVGLENMYQIISKQSGIKLLIFYNLCSGVTEMNNSCMLRVSLLTKKSHFIYRNIKRYCDTNLMQSFVFCVRLWHNNKKMI